MGSGLLTLGDSIDVVLCPGCPTLSARASCAARMEMCSVSPSAFLDSCSVDLGAKRRACCLALKPGCLAQGALPSFCLSFFFVTIFLLLDRYFFLRKLAPENLLVGTGFVAGFVYFVFCL